MYFLGRKIDALFMNGLTVSLVSANFSDQFSIVISHANLCVASKVQVEKYTNSLKFDILFLVRNSKRHNAQGHKENQRQLGSRYWFCTKIVGWTLQENWPQNIEPNEHRCKCISHNWCLQPKSQHKNVSLSKKNCSSKNSNCQAEAKPLRTISRCYLNSILSFVTISYLTSLNPFNCSTERNYNERFGAWDHIIQNTIDV